MAERALTSRPTLQRVEEGDPAVSMGIYVAVLQALSLLDDLGRLAAPATDAGGQALADETLPKCVRLKRSAG